MSTDVGKLAAVLAAFVALVASPLAAQPAGGPVPVAVLDPDPVSDELASTITPGVEVGDALLFGASDSVHDGALWVSDGTAAGTRLAVDPAPPSERWIPLPLATTGDIALVSVQGDDDLADVWLSDGTAAGTLPVPGTTAALLDALSVPAGGYALFHRSVAPSGELWVSDGTLDGTHPLDVGEERSVVLNQAVVLGHRVVFMTRRAGEQDLFVTDGTQAGTVSLAEAIAPRELIDPNLSAFRTSDGSAAFFVATNTSEGREVWVTDGTAAGTRPALYVVPGPSSASLRGYVADGTALSAGAPPRVFVWASVPGSGLELYTNDGLSRPAVRLTDFTGSGQAITGSPSIPMVSHRGRALFVLDFGQGVELWASDARPGTARRLTTLYEGSPEDCRLGFQSSDEGDEALIAVSSGPSEAPVSEREETLWATDGTVAGTRPVLDCFDCGAGRLSTASLDGTLYLVAAPDGPGPRPDRHLYRLDPGGLAQISSAPGGDPDDQADGVSRFAGQVGDDLYFVAATSPGGRQLWATDGTVAGTRSLSRLDNRTSELGPDLLRPTPWNGQLAFLRGQDGEGYDLDALDEEVQLADSVWISDGAEGGTAPVLTSAEARTPVDGFVDLVSGSGGLVVLARLPSGDPSSHGWRLYEVNDTGFRELVDIAPRERAALVAAPSGRLYLQLDDGLFRVEPDASPIDRIGRIGPAVLSGAGGEDDAGRVATLGGVDYLLGDARVATGSGEERVWRLVASDGSFAGTRLVAEGSGVAGTLDRRGDELVFTTVRGPFGGDTDLWRTDGTAAGTERVVGTGLPGRRYELLGVLGERLLLHDGRVLWSTDLASGEAMGLGSGERTIDPEGVVLGDRLIFGSQSPGLGWELFATDGTPRGTRLLDDLWPGPASSAPRNLVTVGDRVLFTAHDGITGDEPWVTDGTVGGSRPLGDLRPGPSSSGPRAYTRVEDQVFFEAVPANGQRTLWKVPVADLEIDTTLPDGPWLTSEALPGFRVKARITARGQAPLPAVVAGDGAADCIDETLCLAGALPDRAEAFVRVVGPKPNGYLWPTLAKFTASEVEVWIERQATGEVRHYVLPEVGPYGEVLDGLFDRRGFLDDTAAAADSLVLRRNSEDLPFFPDEPPPPIPPGQESFTSSDFPGFRFWVRITDQQGGVLPNRQEADCIDETICVSGALPGRSEVFLRVIGPRPNGYLWPVLVRFTTSQVEVWVEYEGSEDFCYYVLEAVTSGSDEIDGLFDRTAFLP